LISTVEKFRGQELAISLLGKSLRRGSLRGTILLRSGSVEQWILEESKVLEAGDVAFIPMDTVHATFVSPDAAEPARLLVVLGPSHGLDGYEAVDASTEEPWASLRS